MLIVKQISKLKWNFSSNKYSDIVTAKSCLSYFVDGAIFTSAYKSGGWDGYHRFYDSSNNFYGGILTDFISNLQEKEQDYEIIPLEDEEFDYVLNSNLRPHQAKSIDKFFYFNGVGIIKIPTRGGKTFVSAEIIRIINENRTNSKFLFVVDNQSLFEQTIEEFSSFLNIDQKEIGIIKEKEFSLKNITVAMIQTIQSIMSGKSKTKVILTKYVQRELTCLIVDEIQEFYSKERLSFLKKCKVNYLLGLSATPFKSQTTYLNNLKLKEIFHDIVYSVTEQELTSKGYLSKSKAILFLIEHKLERSTIISIKNEPKSKRYSLYRDEIILKNDLRDKVIVKTAEILNKLKIKSLFMFQRKEHARTIQSQLHCPMLCGDDKMEVRRSVTKEYLKQESGLLIASDIFKKGITLPEVKVLFNCDGGLEESNVIQKKGRVLGVTKDKDKALIIDFFDLFSEYFTEHSMARMQVYEDSYTSKGVDIFNVSDVDLFTQVEQEIKNWFYSNE